jgi:DNA helicase-2/ATP-dependent DNA helicase PcrA
MDTWINIRRKALTCHEAALKKCKGQRSAKALVDAALKNDDLEVFHYEPGTMAGENVLGFLDRQARIVHVAKHQTPEDELVVVAHEIGHFNLHQDRTNEVTALSTGLGGESVDSGAGKVEGYPHDAEALLAGAPRVDRRRTQSVG